MAKASLFKTITLAQTAELIANIGQVSTVMAQGEMGIGKSYLIKDLAKRFPNHLACYVDITTKDVGDFVIPKIRNIDGVDVCSFIPNEEFGFHFKDQPVIIMLDELGKAKGGVMNACLRLMYERCLGTYRLHPESIVFATTNLSTEGLGDSLPAHARNRMTMVKIAKPTAEEWINDYAIPNNVDPVIISTVSEHPQMLASWEEYVKPEQNYFIHDPRTPRTAFVTHRALVTASHIYKRIKHLKDDGLLVHALAGAIGEAAAQHVLTMINMDIKLPSWGDILKAPEDTPVPDNAAASCLLIMKAVQLVEPDTVGDWMTYMKRMSKESQGLFARSIVSAKCPKASWITTNGTFAKWVSSNHYLFSK